MERGNHFQRRMSRKTLQRRIVFTKPGFQPVQVSSSHEVGRCFLSVLKRRKLARQHRLGVAGASPSGSVGVTQAANMLSRCSHIRLPTLPRGSNRHWEPHVSGSRPRIEQPRWWNQQVLRAIVVTGDSIRSNSDEFEAVTGVGSRRYGYRHCRSIRLAGSDRRDGNGN